jgi:nucleotide-binding universal stress UspA family protein
MPPTNILVPTDFSPCSERALDYACDLAAKTGGTIILVNALGPAPSELRMTLSESMLESTLGAQREAIRMLLDARKGVTFAPPIVSVGDPRDVILEAAKGADADLIVMGTHGRRGLAHLLLGSVAEEIVRTAPCPVLTVREKQRGEAA